MHKSLMYLLVALLTVVVAACGGDGKDGKDGKGGDGKGGDGKEVNGGGETADVWALYKKEGRKWKHKSVTKMEGMDDMVSFMAYEITKVADDHAMQKMTMLDKDGNAMAGMDPTETKIEFKTPEATGDAPADAPKPTEEEVEVAAGKFNCMVTEAAGNKTWTSKDFPGLLVKMEGGTTSMELVEFDK